jgi:hypothetical protein
MSSKHFGQFVSGLTNPKGIMGDFRHAARLFTDDNLRLAPKQKFQFHCVFSINNNALKTINLSERHKNEINMLVKSAELPKFSITTETVNQYNRKKVVQTKLDYQPVSIKFHDDNLGVVRTLWENYYAYYYADSISAKFPGAYNRTAMLNSSQIRTPFGLDNNSAYPFFNKVTIYQMARKFWNSYTLVNPIITSWNHDSLDYSGTGPSEQSMSLAYESVYYENGQVRQNDPPGFGFEHYDTVPSPLTLAGGGTRSLFGQAGVLAGADAVFGNVSRMLTNPQELTLGNILSTAVLATNTYNNAGKLSNRGVTAEITGIATGALGRVANQGVSGVKGTSFPISDPLGGSTPASGRNLTGR